MKALSILMLILSITSCSVYSPRQTVTMPDGETYVAHLVSGTRAVINDGKKLVEFDRREQPGILDKMGTVAAGVVTSKMYEDK
jgi:hypothetical protein